MENILLRDVAPAEFLNGGYDETSTEPWPGKEKNVRVWWILANNYAVGWNENPNRGWSFPVMNCFKLVPLSHA